MLSVLATGTLAADPVRRVSAKGSTFATGLLRIPCDGADATLASLICFDSGAVQALLALHKGDAVSVAGRAALSSWTAKDGTERHGLSVTADRVLSAYQAGKQRKAAREAEEVTA